MAKRLQVILNDAEYREIQRMTRARHMSLAEWVRQALEWARHREPVADVVRKLGVIRAAAKHGYPTGDIDQILSEIKCGYLSGSRS